METIAEILQAVKIGKLSPKKAESLLKLNALAIIGDFARLDYNRFLRRGVPEIVYAENKSIVQLNAIVTKLLQVKAKNREIDVPLILSRVKENQAQPVLEAFTESVGSSKIFQIRYFAEANLIAIAAKNKGSRTPEGGKVALFAAGTSDFSALNESEVILNLMGCRTLRFNDVGVAGLHRLIDPMKQVVELDPDAIVVAAGMEGALPSVIAGLSNVPVIGLPTSVGYGYGRDGEAALMSMLQACSLGVSVVNIDAGVAAGIVAWLISKRVHENRKGKANLRTAI